MSIKKQKASQTETEIIKNSPFRAVISRKERLNGHYRYLLLFLFSLSTISRLFTQQKELDTTSYPENLFEERELSDASDLDVSGDQDYLLEEKTCNKVRSYSK